MNFVITKAKPVVAEVLGCKHGGCNNRGHHVSVM